MQIDKRKILADEVKSLAEKGHVLLLSEVSKHLKEMGSEKNIPELPEEIKKADVKKEYQKWYTLALPVMRKFYRIDCRNSKIATFRTSGRIYLMGRIQ